MRTLARYRPWLIGSIRTDRVRQGSDIDIHLFSDSLALVTNTLDDYNFTHEVEKKRVVERDEGRSFTRIAGRHPFELTLSTEAKTRHVFKNSTTDRAVERASIAEPERAIRGGNPRLDVESALAMVEGPTERFDPDRRPSRPLGPVERGPRSHPGGDDAVDHGSRVVELARGDESPLAAPLHDVGKATDPGDHVGAALIAPHMGTFAHRGGTRETRVRARLERSAHFDDSMLRRGPDSRGRVPDAVACEPIRASRSSKDLASDLAT